MDQQDLNPEVRALMNAEPNADAVALDAAATRLEGAARALRRVAQVPTPMPIDDPLTPLGSLSPTAVRRALKAVAEAERAITNLTEAFQPTDLTLEMRAYFTRAEMKVKLCKRAAKRRRNAAQSHPLAVKAGRERIAARAQMLAAKDGRLDLMKLLTESRARDWLEFEKPFLKTNKPQT